MEQTAIENVDEAGIYLTFGELALAEGRLTDAWLQFRKAASLAESQKKDKKATSFVEVRCYRGLAKVAERRNDWKSVETALVSWLKLEPTNGTVRQRLARALFALDRQDEAYKQLEQAVKDDDSLEPAAVTMGWLYERKGNHEKAERWMEEAVLKFPKQVKVQQGYANWLLERDHLAKAKKHVELAAQLEPDSREIKLLCGQIARASKDFQRAEKYFEAVFQDSPGDFVAGNLLALALIEQADDAKHRRALQLAQLNARQYPRLSQALSTMGWVHYRLGNLDQAEQGLKAAASTGKLSSETGYYMAHVLADRGRLDDVKQLLRSAINSPGPFVQRTDARNWLKRLSQTPAPQTKGDQ